MIKNILYRLLGAPILALFMCVQVSHAQDFFLKEWWNNKEERFPHHFSELTGGFQNSSSFFVGVNYTYLPSKIGFYGSFGMPVESFGYNEFYFSGSIGPTIRLTKSQFTGVDIQLFQGIGLSRVRAHKWPYESVPFVSGETGIRFSFGRDRKFSLWSVSGSVHYSSNGLGWSAGISWPIAGVAAASGLIVGAAIVIGSAGGELPDFGGSSSSSYSTPSSNTSTSSSAGKSCDTYHSQYNSQLSTVMKAYDDYAYAKSRNFSGTQQSVLRKNLVSAQGKLRTIRREAGAHGCSISASPYESKMP